MKKIIVPTDFSVYATGAISLASAIAKKANHTINLQHNIPCLLDWHSLTQEQRAEYPELIAKAKSAQSTLSDLQRADVLKGVRVDNSITYGVTYDQIVKHAEAQDAEMIVLGSHGNENSDRYFIGSNVQKVLRTATCPVLMAKKEVEGKAIKKIVFPSQFEDDIHEHFSFVADFAKDMNATVHLLFVNTPSRFMDARTITRKMKEFEAEYPTLTIESNIYHHFEPEVGILEFCEDIGADLIAMVTHDRRHSARYLIGVTESLVFHTRIPVLSINAVIFQKQLV